MTAVVGRLRRSLESFATAEISSRPLAMLRIFVPLNTMYHHVGSYASFRLDHEPGAMVASWVLWTAAMFLIVGYKTRWAAVFYASAFALLQLHYGLSANWLRLYKPVMEFQLALLLAIAPSGRSLSIDRAIEVNRAEREGRAPEPERMPWWYLEMFVLVICSIYLWAAQDKTDAAWFRGERMERYFVHWYGNSDSFAYKFKYWIHPIAVVSAWATTILEFALAFGLAFRRTRPYLAWGGIMLHIGILTTLAVTYFSFNMLLVLCFACLPPQWIHDFISIVIEDAPGEEPKLGARAQAQIGADGGVCQPDPQG